MSMKGKPKNLDAFLSAAQPDQKGQSEVQSSAPRPAGRITKTIRISPEIDTALKDAAYTRSREAGQRISESDLIDEALKQYFNI